jgi:hypothetical protein
MSPRVILSLCLAACVAGCASPRRAPPDAASTAKSEQELRGVEVQFKLMFFVVAAAHSDHEVAELKPQLVLTPEQESAFREAYTKQSVQIINQMGDAFSSLFRLLVTWKPAPPAETSPLCVPTERELWEPILTPKQLAAYDTIVVARQRKERAAELATERLNRIDSELGLTQDQRNRVFEIYATSEEKGLMATGGYLEPQTDIDLENKSLAIVLTPKQFKKYLKLAASQDSKKKKWYASGYFFPPVFNFNIPSAPGGRSFRAR